MTVLERIAGYWFAVLDASSQAAADLTSRVSTRNKVSAVAAGDRELVLYADGMTDGTVLGRVVMAEPGSPDPVSRLLRRSQVTLELDPGRFIFRAIDLPGRAVDFIEAIVRTQIDRLTPWRSENVVFGWTQPRAKPDGTITVTIAATDRTFVEPLMQRVQQLGAAVVAARVPLPASVLAEGEDTERTLVIARTTAAAFAVAFWRRCLGVATVAVVVLVIGSTIYAQVVSFLTASSSDDLERQIAVRRAEVAKAADARDPAATARRFIEQHKAEVPFATLVLEAVSRILPDDSFVTTFEITGPQLRLAGFTADAPGLIRLIEASNLFTGASFAAPVTRQPDDPGDRFDLQATIRPDAFQR